MSSRSTTVSSKMQRLVAISFCLGLLVSTLPVVNADDSPSSASILPSGSSYHYVCDDDDCTYGIDEQDYMKFYVYEGDRYRVLFENDCPLQYAAASAATYVSSWSSWTRLDCDDSYTWGYNTANSEGYRFVSIIGHDDWAGDQAKIKITLTIDTYNRDSDGDGYPDRNDDFPNDASEWNDADEDGLGDNSDDCVYSYGISWIDREGCPDFDGDGWSNDADDFDYEPTQWSDTDNDGFGDNPYGRQADACMNTYGTSFLDRHGCPDSDYDGASDPDQDWNTWDGADVWPYDSTQWSDRDGDGYGDNSWEGSTTPDACPFEWGNSHIDRYGCPDWDGDGYSDYGDDLYRIPSQWIDSDGDGFGDNKSEGAYQSDDCLGVYGLSYLDRFGCPDSDGDGWSDGDLFVWPAHPVGLADAFPEEASQWRDYDRDGYGDNQSESAFEPDACPDIQGNSYLDRFGCPDSDGDGWSDLNDDFELDSSQWKDSDYDGFGDNADANNGDDCPFEWGSSTNEKQGCLDRDQDGWADIDDAFPIDSTQYLDSDGDGFGDSETGFQPDACVDVQGTSVIDVFGCPDSDGDGWSDQGDKFPTDRLQWLDTDGDDFGDNPFGDIRDDCPDEAGQSTIDRQGCPDSNADGYSDEYGYWEGIKLTHIHI